MPVIIALLHDILITGGVYSLTGREVTSGTVAAFLTILGYSLYGTFSRIRSNTMTVSYSEYPRMVRNAATVPLVTSLPVSE